MPTRTERIQQWLNSYFWWGSTVSLLGLAAIWGGCWYFSYPFVLADHLLFCLAYGFGLSLLIASSYTREQVEAMQKRQADYKAALHAIARFSTLNQFRAFTKFVEEREQGLLLYYSANDMEEEKENLMNLRSFLDRMLKAYDSEGDL